LSERFLIEKRIGQLAEGDQAWLKLERNGRIHGSVNTIGAVTGRCTHSNPNIAQVPGVGSPYGKECRELFCVDEGFKQVGADASGLELRCLAHYMARYDGGAYAKILLEGDIHTENQKAAGLPTRNAAKTFIYAFL
ncbi:MAG: DNA polymerase, partial [Kiritimatiellia bacterium]